MKYIDGHMHLENGPLTKEYVLQFVETAHQKGLDEIQILDHTHRFIEFEPIYEGLKVHDVQKTWLENKKMKFKDHISDFVDLMKDIQAMDLPVKVKYGLEVCYVPQYEDNIREVLSMYSFDFFILLGQMLIRKREMVFYGILLVLIYTIVLDKVLVIGKSQIQVKIISSKFEQINNMIINKLDRGSTLIHGETGFMHNKYPIVLTVVNNRELTLLNNYVYQIDSDAFMIINKVNEVRGKGFSSEKKYIQK